MTVIYHETDGNLNHLQGKRIGVVGYGNMGRPTALNLRDSGVRVLVSDTRTERTDIARAEGFQVAGTDTVVQQSDIILLLYRDEAMPKIYIEHVSPHLRRGQTLIFASAYNVAYGFIETPPFVDVGLVAPCSSGRLVRERYLNGTGVTSFVAVSEDASGQAWQTVLALAKALGALRGGAIELRFEQESELDLFLHQAVVPALHHILLTAAEFLLEQGYPPEAVFTSLYLSGELADTLNLAARHGLLNALKLTSLTSQYGTLSRYERFGESKIERLMEVTLNEIRDGRFAKEWGKEFTSGYRHLDQLRKQQERQDIWELEQQTLELLLQREDDDF